MAGTDGTPDGMIFAAGLGTRLAPLTDRMPKALLEVGGVPMLERVALRMKAAGVGHLVVNVCPFADRIEAFVRERMGFGLDVEISRETPSPLETGGGLRAAIPMLRPGKPVLLHNVDVVTDLPLEDLARQHARRGALATLAVMERPSSRRLLFDDRGLVGRVSETEKVRIVVREPVGPVREWAFAGVHVIDASFPGRVTETGRFSILEPYLRLAAGGETILPFRADGHAWIDIGKPADLEAARARAAG